MDRLWKYLMQLDAKALFFGSVVLFVAVLGLVVWRIYLHPADQKTQPNTTTESSIHTERRAIGLLGVVSNQMTATSRLAPANPFRPSIENLLLHTSPTTPAGTNQWWILPQTNNATIRNTNNVPIKPPRPPNHGTGKSGPATLTFRGYFERPDNTPVALFHNSADDTESFFVPGSQIKNATLLTATIHTARVQKADGQIVDLAIGDSFKLPAEKP